MEHQIHTERAADLKPGLTAAVNIYPQVNGGDMCLIGESLPAEPL